MATEWKKVKLQEICESISDGDHLPPPKAEKGIPFVTISNIKDNQLDFTDTMFVPETYYEKLDNKRKAKTGDILYSVVGSFGIPVLLKRDEKFVFQRHIAILRPNKIESSFLYYTMLGRDFYAKADAAAIGAAQRTVSLTSLRNIEICLPPLETQQKIAGILSAYDDLIENNRRQIKLLEEAAQKLYKEWFVKLNFPGHENVKIVDGIPEGWIETDINSICTKINAGGTPNRKKSEYWTDKDVKWFKTKELQDCWLYDSEEYISQKGLENSSAKIFPENTILMAIYASPTLGRLGILTNEACCNQAALCMIANEEIISYQWLYLKLLELREYFNSVARGAGQQNISADVVKNKTILLPSKSLLDIFTKIIKPYFDKIRYLQNQIQLLQSARDKLLPKLMNGEVEV